MKRPLLNYFIIASVFALVVIGCKKKDNGSSGGGVSPQSGTFVSVSEIEMASVINATSTFRVACKAVGSAPLRYHWMATNGSFSFDPKNSATGGSFEHGEWTDWNLSTSKSITITVYAYTQEGGGSGPAQAFYEYDLYGNLVTTHYFYHNMRGTFWDSKSITVTDAQLNGQLRLNISKSYSMGVIDTNTGQRICQEADSTCQADFAKGTQVTLIPSSLSPLYTFEGWGPSSGPCSSFGKNNCQFTMNSNIDISMYNSFKEINVDGAYTGLTEQNRPFTLTVSNNIVTFNGEIEMGSGSCVYNLNETDDYNLFYVSSDQTLLFYIGESGKKSISGHFTSPSLVHGLIFLDTNLIPGTAAECRDRKFIDYNNGGLAALSAASSAGHPELEMSRAERLKSEARNRERFR